MPNTIYSRIDRAWCPRCGDKGGIYYHGRTYPLPATVETQYVETTRPKCQCGYAVRLTVQPVEGEQ